MCVLLHSVPQAGFLQPGIDGFCCPRPYRVVSLHERRNLCRAQLEAAFAYRLQSAFRIVEELEAEFFVRYQPANEHFDNPLRHGHLLSLLRQGKLRTGSSHGLANDKIAADFRWFVGGWPLLSNPRTRKGERRILTRSVHFVLGRASLGKSLLLAEEDRRPRRAFQAER
jgi:hypothetical protein